MSFDIDFDTFLLPIPAIVQDGRMCNSAKERKRKKNLSDMTFQFKNFEQGKKGNSFSFFSFPFFLIRAINIYHSILILLIAAIVQDGRTRQKVFNSI